MEGTTDVEAQSTLSTSFLEGFASAVDSVDVTRDDELTRAVEVGSDDYPTLNALEDLDDLLIGQAEDSRHRTRVSFASLLHSQSTLGDETKTVFEAQRTSSDECGELTERVTSDHIGLEFVTEAERTDDGVQEDRGLRDLRLLELFVRTSEHNVRDAESEDIVGLLKELLG